MFRHINFFDNPDCPVTRWEYYIHLFTRRVFSPIQDIKFFNNEEERDCFLAGIGILDKLLDEQYMGPDLENTYRWLSPEGLFNVNDVTIMKFKLFILDFSLVKDIQALGYQALITQTIPFDWRSREDLIPARIRLGLSERFNKYLDRTPNEDEERLPSMCRLA